MHESQEPQGLSLLSSSKKEGKGKDKPNKDKTDKIPSKPVLYVEVADAINRRISLLPKFQRQFHVIQIAPGVRQILEELEGECVHEVPEKEVSRAIHNYTIKELKHRFGFQWSMKTCVEAFQTWEAYTDPIERPAIVLWQGESGRTYSRLPWERTLHPTAADCPLFMELLNRTTNGEALKLFIGSLFDPLADRQQYIWLFGAGFDGKGSLIRFLSRVFGQAFCSLEVQENNKHWTHQLLGKRLAAFPDINNYSFPLSGLFKRLTGDDLVSIDPKGKTAFTTRLNTKFIIASNRKPELSSERSDMRRAIYCEMQGVPNSVTNAERALYEERLWKEGGAFLSLCINDYNVKVPHHGPLPVDKEVLTGLVSANEEEWDLLATKHFIFGKYFEEREKVRNILKNEKLNKVEIRDFMAYLGRTFGVQQRHVHPPHVMKEGDYWQGIKVKDSWTGL